MAANKSALLILQRPRGRLRIEPLGKVIDGIFDVPLSWQLFGRFRGAQLLDSSFRLWDVKGASVVGLAGPKVIGVSLAEYLWWMLVTIPFLQMPTLLRFSLADPRQLSLVEARTYIGDVVSKSKLFPDVKTQLSRRILGAKSVTAMARAIDDARE